MWNLGLGEDSVVLTVMLKFIRGFKATLLDSLILWPLCFWQGS